MNTTLVRILAWALALIIVSVSVSAQTTQNTQTINYTYDKMGRLLTATYSNGMRFVYTYDANGNRLTAKLEKVGEQAQGLTPEQQVSQQAIPKLEQLIASHPEPLVREKLNAWIESGTVLFAANNILPEMSASLEGSGEKKQILLWYNINFLMQVPNASLIDKKTYLWLVLYHEAVHIDDHLSGRLSLGPLIATGSASPADMAENIWDREWGAVSKEWILARKLEKAHLVPVIYAATQNGNTPRNFLEGFYRLQMTGNAVRLNRSLAMGFTLRYQKELARLERQRAK